MEEGALDGELVVVAGVLLGDELAAALLAGGDGDGVVLDAAAPPCPRSDAAPEAMELAEPCRLLKTFASSQFACVKANKTARMDSRRIWGRENIMMMVGVLMEEDEVWREKIWKSGLLFRPLSYSRFVDLICFVSGLPRVYEEAWAGGWRTTVGNKVL